MSGSLSQKIAQLHNFSACDVSDALLRLQDSPAGAAARAGFLADIVPFAPQLGRSGASQPKVIAPACTFKFVSKNPDLAIGSGAQPASSIPSSQLADAHGFPPGKHWVDWAEPGTVVVLEQPAGQFCAVLGGIMAARMKYLDVEAVVVSGRVRDLAELKDSGLPVWARASSTVGTGAEAKPGERNVPVSIEGVIVSPGDIIFCDPLEGVVSIPRDLVDAVLDLMPKLVAMDDKVKIAVSSGSSVHDAFQKFRS